MNTISVPFCIWSYIKSQNVPLQISWGSVPHSVQVMFEKAFWFAVSSNFHTRSLWQSCWVRQVQAVLRASQPDVTKFAKRRALLFLLPMSDLFSGKLPSTVQSWETELLSQLLQNWKKLILYFNLIFFLLYLNSKTVRLFWFVFKCPNVDQMLLHLHY